MKHYFIAVLFISFYGCNTPHTASDKIIYGETLFADSFEVKGIEARTEIQSFWHLNDTCLLSFNIEGSRVRYYSNKKNKRIYLPRISNNLAPQRFLPGFFRDDKGNFMAMDNKQQLLRYNKDFTLKDSMYFNYNPPYYKRGFQLARTGTLPAISLGDTLICFISHNDVADYLPYSFKERPLIESIWKEGRIVKTERLFEKPANLIKYISYYGPFYAYNKAQNKLVLAYPCFDTLYTYNRSAKNYEKIPIGNKDFKPLEEYDQSRGSDFAYLTKYGLNNFSYHALYFNELTGHYLLFYTTPNKAGSIKNRKQKAIVLNHDYKILHYLNFSYRYGDIQNLFFYPGKGLVLPREKSPTDYEDTKFYILNF